MIARAIGVEFVKMRHLGVASTAATLVVGVVGLTAFTTIAAAHDITSATSWTAVLARLSLAFPMVSPLLIAILASRQVDIENTGGGWIAAGTAGVPPGRLCRAKFGAASTLVTAATVTASACALALGTVLGFTRPVPLLQWTTFTVAMIVVNGAVLATQIVVSRLVLNQLVALGVGLLGTVAAVFAGGLPGWAAHVTPWGWYSVLRAADYRGDDPVALAISVPTLVVFATVALVGFVVATALLDNQEV
ncbi:ABC transporter permease [Gordonia soli]|uniref:ABC transporter permease protein n=1 Tax=Gordonia soli NBRC 108243 TaxID=1223545 RepID=M0QHN2_9ACTN|nr:ABC transporter permease [Gordonia soli]GAC66912.1 hypothetical protein GS4_05_01210 [Gordonia soli NBRC 108243]